MPHINLVARITKKNNNRGREGRRKRIREIEKAVFSWGSLHCTGGVPIKVRKPCIFSYENNLSCLQTTFFTFVEIFFYEYFIYTLPTFLIGLPSLYRPSEFRKFSLIFLYWYNLICFTVWFFEVH